MYIVIGGEDEVAFRLAEFLMHDHEVVLVHPEDAASPRVDRLDVEVIHGPHHSTQTLRRANLERANLFVACGIADEQNLVACVAAKQLGAERSTCFLFRRDPRGTVDDGPALARYLRIDDVIRPAEQLAQEILRIVGVPGALDVEIFAGGKVQLLRHKVEEGAYITRGPLREIGVPPGVVLVMARRGDEIFLPKGDTAFQGGDKLTVMGSLVGINRLMYGYLRSQEHGMEKRRATVVGGGVVGTSVAERLSHAGWTVRVIEHNRDRCEEISARLDCLVLHGNGTDMELLEEENVGDDSVLVAVTSNDEMNLLISLLAKHMGVPRIVTRADKPSNERLFEKVGIDVVRSARGAAIQSVVRGVVAAQTDMLAELEHGDAMVLELEVPEELPPTPLVNLRAPVFAIIGAILRERRVIIPQGRDSVQGKDHILVFCIKEYEDQVRDFFLKEILKRSR